MEFTMRSLSWGTVTGYLLSGCLFLGLAGNIMADTINLPAKMNNYAMELPGRGMSKATVEQRFGQPEYKSDAVGKPPISKWHYELFTVYFESNFVIHAVINRDK